MAFPRIQVADIGSSLMKSMIGFPGKDGGLEVEAARCDPLPPGWDRSPGDTSDLLATLATLSKGFFRRREPVHVTTGERVLRTCLWPAASVPDSGVEEWLRVSSNTFAESLGPRRRGAPHSTVMRREAAGALVTVTAVHSQANSDALESLVAVFERADLKCAGVYSPIPACAALFRSIPEQLPRVIIDAGHAATRLYLLEGPIPVAQRTVYFGGEDFEFAVREGADVAGDLSGRQFYSEEDGHGPEALERALRSWLRAVQLGIRELLRPRVSEEDAESDGGLDPPAVEIASAGSVGLMGGLAAWPRLRAQLERELGIPCLPLDAWALASRRPSTVGDAAAPIFGAALGLLKLLSEPAYQTDNVAASFLAARAGQAPPPEPAHRIVGRLVLASVVVVSLVVGSLTGYAFSLRASIREMSRRRDHEVRALPDVKEVIKIVQAYRKARTRQVITRTRAQFLEDLLEKCADWPGIFGLVHAAFPAHGLAVTGVEFELSWPRANLSQAGHAVEKKSVRFAIDCESDSNVTFTQFLKNLGQVSNFSKVESPRHRLAATTPQDIQKHEFRVVGEVELDPARP